MQKIRILVVEDDLELRETLEEVLSDEGYEVAVAERGEDAVTLASQALFDLVVTDIKMPGIDGLEALEQMKQRQPEVKSLVVTGYSSHQDAVRAVRLGVGEYLQKPFGLDSLLERVNEMVAERRQELAEKGRQQEYLQATLTSLRLAASLLEPKLLEAARLAEDLAGPTRAVLAATLTLALGCRKQAPDEECRDFGPYLEPYLQKSAEHWDGSGPDGLLGEEIPIESRVAALALFVSTHSDSVLPEGHFDPELAAKLESPHDHVATNSSDRRSLLALGQAFERGGDLENAFRAYESVLAGAKPSLSSFEARLGKARLERAVAGENLPEQLKELQDSVTSLGPAVRARASLESGLLLLPQPQAKECLLAAREQFDDLNDELGMARADLGLATMGVESPYKLALTHLLRPEHVWELCDAAPWLLPWMLNNPGLVDSEAVVQVLREAPQALKTCLESELLSLEAKLAAVDALRSQEGALPQRALGVLLQDQNPQLQKALAALNLSARGGLDVGSLRLNSFGPFTVSRGDEQIPESAWKHQKIKYLLAYLGKNWRAPVQDEQLMEEFWPGPADRAKRSLYQATYNLRRCLKAAASESVTLGSSSDVDYVRRQRGHLSLNEDFPIWNDYRELEEALDGGCIPDNRVLLNRALSLYKGPYLERCYMDWAETARQSLELRVMEAREWLAQDGLRQNRGEEALFHAQQLLEMDPLHSAGQLLTMEALVSLEANERALEHFESCRLLLAKELNLEPSIEMLELQQRAKLGGEPSGLIG